MGRHRDPITILKARLDKVEMKNKELKEELKYVRSMGNNNWRNNYELEKKVEKIIRHLRGRDMWVVEEKPMHRKLVRESLSNNLSNWFSYCRWCNKFRPEFHQCV